MINQQKFIWMSRSIPRTLKITQGENATVMVELTDDIQLLHKSARSGDKLDITFKPDNEIFSIKDEDTLTKIYKIFIGADDPYKMLHLFCTENIPNN